MISCTAFAKSSSRTLEYLRSNSWQKGHPKDRKNTTMETPSSLDGNSWFMVMTSPLRVKKVDFVISSRGLMDNAFLEGFPEVIVVGQPHSS